MGGDPVPTGMERYILRHAASGRQQDGVTVIATVDIAMREEDVLTRGEIIHLAGGCLP